MDKILLMETRRLTWRFTVNSLLLLACMNQCPEPASSPFPSHSDKETLVWVQMSSVSFLLIPGPADIPRTGLWCCTTARGIGLPRQQGICYKLAMQSIPAQQGIRAVERWTCCTVQSHVSCTAVHWTRYVWRKLARVLGKWVRMAALTTDWLQMKLTTHVWQRGRREAEAELLDLFSEFLLTPWINCNPEYLPVCTVNFFSDLCEYMQNLQGNSVSDPTIKSYAYR